MQHARAENWNHWLYIHSADTPRPLKSHVAERLGISPSEFSKRLAPDRYRPAVSDSEVAMTALMWNQPEEYVRGLFPRRPHRGSGSERV